MRFSVIIPLYNKAPYVRKALASVFAQTYTDYELIIVDDGSTDDSAKIAEEFIDSSFPLGRAGVGFFRQPNAGVSAARNNGVAQARGEYLAFLDADDWWEPNYLERMAQLITDYPDAGLYACNYVYYKPGKTHVALDIPTGYINYPKIYCDYGIMPLTSISVVIPKNVFDVTGGFPSNIRLGEDFLLWTNIAMHFPIAFLSEALAWYNNNLLPSKRATRNIYPPKQYMAFWLDEYILNRLKNIDDSTTFLSSDTAQSIPKPTAQDWVRLIDKIRVEGMLNYWLSDEYHDAAAAELAKVDWDKQPASVKRIYKTPICLLKMKRMVMQVGSFVKQMVINTIVR